MDSKTCARNLKLIADSQRILEDLQDRDDTYPVPVYVGKSMAVLINDLIHILIKETQ